MYDLVAALPVDGGGEGWRRWFWGGGACGEFSPDLAPSPLEVGAKPQSWVHIERPLSELSVGDKVWVRV